MQVVHRFDKLVAINHATSPATETRNWISSRSISFFNAAAGEFEQPTLGSFTGLSAPGVLNPAAHVTVTQGETFRHVDGTVGRKIYIQNLAPFNPCAVDLLQLIDSF